MEQQKSATSNDKKENKKENRHEILVRMNLYSGLLERFHVFVNVFQSEKPLVHMLHREMVNITRKTIGVFIKQEFISDSVREVLKLDVSDKTLQRTDKELLVGQYANENLDKAHSFVLYTQFEDQSVLKPTSSCSICLWTTLRKHVHALYSEFSRQ